MANYGNRIKYDIVKKYLSKYPKLSKKAISRLLVKQEPLIFKNQETARSIIRYYTRSLGNISRNLNIDDKINHNTDYSKDNPYGIPKSYYEERNPFILPKSENNILIISDLHIPYHDFDSIKCALDYGKKAKVNTIFINGDLLDFHVLSRFLKDPRKRNVKEEMDAAFDFLTGLRKSFKNCAIYFHFGNHDMRYQIWLMSHPEIFGDPYYELENRLQLGKLKIKVIDDRTITKAGKLSIHHGHYIFRGQTSPVSPARTMLLKAKQSMICGHTHKISEATAINLDGEIYSCWSTGSLCELTPEYSPMCNDYAHGFAHARINDDGHFTLRNIRVHNGKIL
jgi:predicted phosphodiesterase